MTKLPRLPILGPTEDLNRVPFNDRRRPSQALPDDPAHYRAKILTDDDRANMERWAFNFFTTTGHRMRLPVGLYDVLKADGVNVAHMEPILPTLF